jgi:hypothetical protein
MSLALQAKLLRVLQDQSFERVGRTETIRTDVRVIAATHRDLKAWSLEERFRPELEAAVTAALHPRESSGRTAPRRVRRGWGAGTTVQSVTFSWGFSWGCQRLLAGPCQAH